ncbi:hypothetical protein E2C01_061527 [Portunus trituberculatus]|uniref:Uncharacterized protein n=1 Tax=Portunus trituberculatus TaxID=210409 RepID=A0A5B7H8D5_PORTR|nr:hypothetical protein [Portunus trituberculatus]
MTPFTFPSLTPLRVPSCLPARLPSGHPALPAASSLLPPQSPAGLHLIWSLPHAKCLSSCSVHSVMFPPSPEITRSII